MTSKFAQFFLACVLGQFIFLAQGASASASSKKGKVVYATIPELAWVLRRLAPEETEIESLLEPGVNAHYVDAKPSFIMKLKKADMVCSVGLGLEGAWLGRAIERSFNDKLDSSHKCEVGNAISVMGLPDSPMDRSHGHMHAQGNPHFWYAPSRMIEAVDFLSKRLQFLFEDEPSKVETIGKKAEELKLQLKTVLGKARKILAKKSGKTVSQYHSDFDYLIEDLDLKKSMSIESKPGMPPSVAHLSAFKNTIEEEKVKVILSLPWDPGSVVSKLAEDVGAKVVTWPVEEGNYLKAFEAFVASLDGGLQ